VLKAIAKAPKPGTSAFGFGVRLSWLPKLVVAPGAATAKLFRLMDWLVWWI